MTQRKRIEQNEGGLDLRYSIIFINFESVQDDKSISICKASNFKKLYEAHMSALRNFIYYKNGDMDEAHDIAQEAYTILWERCKEIEYEKAKSYLFTTVHNLFITKIRKEKVKITFIKRSPPKAYDKSDQPDFILDESQFKMKLENAISALPDKQREVFLMNRIDKFTYNEIAELLGVSIKTIEKRMQQSLFKLRQDVDELNLFKI